VVTSKNDVIAQVHRIASSAVDIIEDKQLMYGDAWLQLKPDEVRVLIWQKARKVLVMARVEPVEKLREELCDLINWVALLEVLSGGHEADNDIPGERHAR